MKIGIMSDSHDHLENIVRCVRMFRDRAVDYVVHLGDYVNPNSVRALEGIRVRGIFGNNDGDKFRLAAAYAAVDGELKGDFWEFREGGLLFACYHGTDLPIKDALAQCGTYDVVLYGHTHSSEITKVGKTLILNPGTCHGFGGQATVMIFDTKTKEAEILDL